MDNISIRIKFSPLMKEITKVNSKCCIEIIPLVSEVENLDKIKWKEKNEVIEYIVPMTYKVILKKRKFNPTRTYYSCIDFVSGSLSNVDIGADLYRVLSDITVSKERKDSLEDLIFLRKLDVIPSDDVVIGSSDSNAIDIKNTVESIDYYTSQINKEHHHEQSEEGDKYVREELNDEINTLDKSTNTENHSPKTENKCTYSKCSYSSNNQEVKRNLCVTPVCKINTVDYICDKFTTNVRMNYISYLINELDNIKATVTNTRINIMEKSLLGNNFDNNEELVISNCRIQPEMRIAHFVCNMEKEIFPLKIILNNIIHKCSTLGLSNYLSTSKTEQQKTIPLDDKQITKYDVRKKKNNRVVYSIVFDK